MPMMSAWKLLTTTSSTNMHLIYVASSFLQTLTREIKENVFLEKNEATFLFILKCAEPLIVSRE